MLAHTRHYHHLILSDLFSMQWQLSPKITICVAITTQCLCYQIVHRRYFKSEEFRIWQEAVHLLCTLYCCTCWKYTEDILTPVVLMKVTDGSDLLRSRSNQFNHLHFNTGTRENVCWANFFSHRIWNTHAHKWNSGRQITAHQMTWCSLGILCISIHQYKGIIHCVVYYKTGWGYSPTLTYSHSFAINLYPK